MVADRSITDYTNRDYASLLASMLDLAALKLPEWTDRSENDFGRLLLELFAYTGDVQLYYQDRIANEAFLATAVERRSVIDLLALIGYTLGTSAPASAELKLTVTDASVNSVRVEVGAKFATQVSPGKPAIEFVYLPNNNQDLNVARPVNGQFEFSIQALNVSQIQDEIIGTSIGEPNQSFRLLQQPVLLPRDPDAQDYLRLEVNTGGGFQVWQRRGTLVNSKSGDRHFVVQIDENDAATILFGDGTYGNIPPAGVPIKVSYAIGGGAIGNVGAGTITLINSGVNPKVNVTNPKAATGGADRESIEHARRLAPAVYRSSQRAVTAEDYAALAANVPGVAKAVAIAPSWNYVDLYIVAAGGFVLTDDLRARLLRYFDSRRMVTTVVNIRQPVFVSINISITVEVEPTSYREDVRQRVDRVIADLFQIDRLDFGQPFYLSTIYEVVGAIDGVLSSNITTFSSTRSDRPIPLDNLTSNRLQLNPREFPRPGTILPTVNGGLI